MFFDDVLTAEGFSGLLEMLTALKDEEAVEVSHRARFLAEHVNEKIHRYAAPAIGAVCPHVVGNTSLP